MVLCPAQKGKRLMRTITFGRITEADIQKRGFAYCEPNRPRHTETSQDEVLWVHRAKKVTPQAWQDFTALTTLGTTNAKQTPPQADPNGRYYQVQVDVYARSAQTGTAAYYGTRTDMLAFKPDGNGEFVAEHLEPVPVYGKADKRLLLASPLLKYKKI